jgi:hypothetical protein
VLNSTIRATALLIASTVALGAVPDRDPSSGGPAAEDTDAPGAAMLAPTRTRATGPPTPLGALPPELAARALEVSDRPLPERMAAISKQMLGRPYLADPLGEGRGIDADPLARYDVYDCLTFVEEVLALSLAGDPAHAARVRLALRYGDGPIEYRTRRHFMELQWIPGNIADGWLADTTATYGPVTHLERAVDADTWHSWRSRARFAMSDEELPVGTMQLDVLSLDDALAAVDDIRPGSILLTVREDRSWNPIWISHVGFVLPTEAGQPRQVRHATRMSSKTVRDHDLAWYLRHLKTYSKWPAVGVAVLEPIEQGPRLARLSPP